MKYYLLVITLLVSLLVNSQTVPTLVSPSNGSITYQINQRLDWTSVSGNQGYAFEVDTTSLFNSSAKVSGSSPNNTSLTDVPNLRFDQQYFWRVATKTAAGNSAWSTTFSFTTPSRVNLNTPANNAIDISTSANLRWLALKGHNGYIYEVDTSSNFNSPQLLSGAVGSSSINATGVNLNDLLFGSTYFWRVAAKSINDTSDWSLIRTFQTIERPTLVLPANNSTGLGVEVTLDWSFVQGNNGYLFQLDTSASFNSSLLFNVNQPNNVSQSTVSDLNFGTTYFWRVAAINANDTSNWSLVRNFTTLNQVNLVTPLNNAQGIGGGQTLDWSFVRGNHGYIYEVDITLAFNSNLLKQGTSPSSTSQAAVNDLLFGTAHYWRVAATSLNDTSQWSIIRTFVTIDSVLLISPPNNSTNVNVQERLDWAAVLGNNGYLYELDTVPSFNSPFYFLGNSNLNTSEIIETNLRYGTTYFWRAAVKNNVDTSQWSSTFQFTTKSNVIPVSPSNGAIDQAIRPTLNWSGIFRSTNYIYEIDTTVNFNSPLLLAGNTNRISSNFQPTHLHYGTKYYWRIKAFHINDTSEWSTVSSFTTIDHFSYGNPANNAIGVPINQILTWNRISFSDYYNYEVDEVPTFNSAALQSGNTNSNTVKTAQGLNNLKYGQDYYWRVAAVSSVDTSSFQGVRKFTTAFQLTNSPIQISPSNGVINLNRSNITLDWDTVSNATSYQYQIDTANNFTNSSQTFSVPTSQITLNRLDNFTTYYWRVRAINNAGNSPWSGVWSFTTENCETRDTLTINSCGPYTINGTTYNATGTYFQTLTNSQLCDSTLKIDLTVAAPINDSVTQNGTFLTASQLTGSYQWLDCNNGYAVIQREILQTFRPRNNGSYAVELTVNNCVDTSDCILVSTVGVESFQANEPNFKVYPNPTKGDITIELKNLGGAVEVKFYSVTGELVESSHFSNSKKVIVNVPGEPGVYLLKLMHGGEVSYSKVVKK